MALQEDHRIANGALLAPSLLDLAASLRADPAHPPQLGRLVVDHLERVQPELLDQSVCHDRPDPGHQSGAEIALDAVECLGEEAQVGDDAELLAVLAILFPTAGEAHPLSRLQTIETTHSGRRDAVVAADAEDAPAALFRLEDHPLNGRVERLEQRVVAACFVFRRPHLEALLCARMAG